MKTAEFTVDEFSGGLTESAEIAALHLVVRQWEHANGQYVFQDMYNSQVDLGDISTHYQIPGGNFWVARESIDDEITGFVGLKKTGEDTGMMKRLAVLPHWHGNRIGTLLVGSLIDWAGDNGFRSLELTTGIDEKALPIYERFGFVITGFLDDSKYDHVMKLDLS